MAPMNVADPEDKYEMVIVVCSPLQLTNSLEFAYDEGVDLSKVIVIFSAKNTNPGKQEQAEKILAVANPGKVIFHIRYCKIHRLLHLAGLRPVFRSIMSAFNRLRMSLLIRKLSFGLDPLWIVGFGAYLELAAKFFPQACTCTVDGGNSSLRGNLTEGRTEKSLYFSIYPASDIGVSPERFRHNRNLIRLMTLRDLPLNDRIGIFVSANTYGKLTNQVWYNGILEKAKNLHSGDLIYYRRSNEPKVDALNLCEKHGMIYSEIGMPIEDFVCYELALVPGSVFSVASTAMQFFGSNFFCGKCENYCFTPSVSYSQENFFYRRREIFEFAEKNLANVKFISF